MTYLKQFILYPNGGIAFNPIGMIQIIAGFNNNIAKFHAFMARHAASNKIVKIVGFLVIGIPVWNVIEFSKWNNVMNIHFSAIFIFIYTAYFAMMISSVSGAIPLVYPVGAIIFNSPTFPIKMIITSLFFTDPFHSTRITSFCFDIFNDRTAIHACQLCLPPPNFSSTRHASSGTVLFKFYTTIKTIFRLSCCAGYPVTFFRTTFPSIILRRRERKNFAANYARLFGPSSFRFIRTIFRTISLSVNQRFLNIYFFVALKAVFVNTIFSRHNHPKQKSPLVQIVYLLSRKQICTKGLHFNNSIFLVIRQLFCLRDTYIIAHLI